MRTDRRMRSVTGARAPRTQKIVRQRIGPVADSTHLRSEGCVQKITLPEWHQPRACREAARQMSERSGWNLARRFHRPGDVVVEHRQHDRRRTYAVDKCGSDHFNQSPHSLRASHRTSAELAAAPV